MAPWFLAFTVASERYNELRKAWQTLSVYSTGFCHSEGCEKWVLFARNWCTDYVGREAEFRASNPFRTLDMVANSALNNHRNTQQYDRQRSASKPSNGVQKGVPGGSIKFLIGDSRSKTKLLK